MHITFYQKVLVFDLFCRSLSEVKGLPMTAQTHLWKIREIFVYLLSGAMPYLNSKYPDHTLALTGALLPSILQYS